MRGGLIISVAFHMAVLLALLIGLPHFDSTPKASPPPIAVEVVRLSDTTSAPKGTKPQPKTEKKPDADKTTAKEPARRDPKAGDKGKDAKTAEVETKPEPKRPEAKPEPKPQPKAKPEPPKTPKPKVEAKAKPEPKPEPKATPKPEPEKVEVAPRPKAEKKPEKKQIAEANPPKTKTEKPEAEKTEPEEKRKRIVARPQVRPKTPRRVAREEPEKRPEKKKPEKKVAKKKRGDVKSMDSVFKTVNEFKRKTQDTDKAEQTARRQPVGRETAKKSAPLTISDLDAIRRQIQPCWYFPAGARNPESLQVQIRLRLRPDGSLISAEVKDRARMASDSYYRAAAEAALRAVRNPQCSPLRLPPAKYDQWKSLTVEFDPAKLKAG